MRTLIRGAVVVTCDADHTVLSQGDVVIEDAHLVYVGSAYEGEYDHLVPAQGKLLMPGLINAHTHTPMSLFRGVADDVDLRTFLEERAWPREARLTSEHVYAGSSLSLLEMLKAGVTTYVDMYFYEEDLTRAALDSGLRAIITPGILEAPGLTSVLGSWEQRTRQVLDFRERWEGREGRITTGLGPHALYTLPLEALAAIATEARQAQALTHVHLCETRQEVAEFSARGLGTPVAALASVGFFEGKVLAAHSVWLDDQDIQTYAAQGVGVAHCPLSNAKLGAGVAPVPRFVASNINVGLGTDGAATNNSLDLWEEMRFAPLLAKAVGLDPTLLPAREMLWMATRRGALAINRPDLGALVPGYKADLLLLRLDDTTTTPILDEQSYVGHLVNSMTSRLVDSVWVNGQLLLSGGEVLRTDEEKVRARAQRAGEELSGRASVPSTHLVSHPASVNHTVEDAVRAIQSRYTGVPRIGVVLGSWLLPVADAVTDRTVLPFDSLPGFPLPRESRTSGELVLGRLENHDVAVLTNRVHLYEGYTADQVVHTLRVLDTLGVSTVILTNAAGSLKPALSPGRLVLLSDHINLTGQNPLVGAGRRDGPRYPDMSDAYSAQLRSSIMDAASASGVKIEQGVYAGVLGPSLETPAEITALQALGADVIGMSTVLETIAAVQAGMRVVGISMVSNYAAGVGDGTVEWGAPEETVAALISLIRAFLRAYRPPPSPLAVDRIAMRRK